MTHEYKTTGVLPIDKVNLMGQRDWRLVAVCYREDLMYWEKELLELEFEFAPDHRPILYGLEE